MLTETIIDQTPVWLLYTLTVLLLFGGSELGYRLGGWRRKRMSEGEKTPANTLMGSSLGLLAFLLAFTLGMSSTRFDARRQLVLDEASAILRAYQRVQFLPPPQREECSRLLHEYVAARNTLFVEKQLGDVAHIEQLLRHSEDVQIGRAHV